MELEAMLQGQRDYFAAGNTLPPFARVEMLKKLRDEIRRSEAEIAAALQADLNKCKAESYMTEIGMVLDELGCLIKNTARWAKPKRARTPLAQFAAKSYVVQQPYGCTLIMAPWNYPFLLSMSPLAGAVSAGNCVVLKPSAYAPHTSSMMAQLCARVFPPEWVSVVEGGRKENNALLDQKFDYIFFTGSVGVGKLVMEKAARHLTPVSLELGGKSPVVVDASANIPLAAKRIAFGKLLNAGQTCVAPDYVLVHESVREELVRQLEHQFRQMLGEAPLQASDFVRIVNGKHFARLQGILAGCTILCGGNSKADEVSGSGWIEPTLVADTLKAESPAMAEEIFGPILPIIPVENIEQAVQFINARPHPLALYLFTETDAVRRMVLDRCSFGGGCVNDTIIHLATHQMPFGGVGDSGMGGYHGRSSFETFTHQKSIVDKATWLDLPMRYRPYSAANQKLIRMFLK